MILSHRTQSQYMVEALNLSIVAELKHVNYA